MEYCLEVGCQVGNKKEDKKKYGEVHFVYEMAPYKVCRGH